MPKIFDEWGNQIGEIAPSEGGGWVVLILAVFFLIGFAIYAIFALSKECFHVVKEKRWETIKWKEAIHNPTVAFALFLVAFCLVYFLLFLLIQSLT